VDEKAIELGLQSFRLWANHFTEWDPKPYQEYFVCHPARDKLWQAGIRSGKSCTAAEGHLYAGFYRPGGRGINTSISLDQSRIVFNECLTRAARTRLEPYIEDVVRQPYPVIKLVNGYEIWFRSLGYEAELIRGWEFDIASVDEVGYVPSEDTIKFLKGRLLGVSRLGWLWLIGTPKGRGWLWGRWKKGDPEFPEYAAANPDPTRPVYMSMRTTSFQNDSLDRQMLEELADSYSERMRQAELMGVMLDDVDAVFPLDDIMACRNEDLTQAVLKGLESQGQEPDPQDGLNNFALPPERGHQYVLSVDLGKGKLKRAGRGATVALVLDISTTPWQVVAFRYVTGAGYKIATPLIQELKSEYRAEVVLDSTGPGDPVDERLQEEEGIPIELSLRHTGVSKPQMLHFMQLALERRLVEYPFIKLLIDEMRDYAWEDKGIAQDCVMTLAQALWLGRLIKEPIRSHDKRVVGAVAMSHQIQRNRMRTQRGPGARSRWRS
jgi:hypothetical protein